MTGRRCWSLLLLTLTVILPPCRLLMADEFQAAAVRTEITPEPNLPMWGYSNRSGPSTGTLDPLYAKILLLDVGETRMALVTLDLGRTFGHLSMQAVRARVERSADVDQVFFFASHTHSGPVVEDWTANNQRPAWETTALGKIAAAIELASKNLVSARIGTGYGETFIGHNRRYIQADGSVKMLWRNASKVPTQPVDPRVGVIRVDDAGHRNGNLPASAADSDELAPEETGSPLEQNRLSGGGTLAVVVNYACHPVVLGPDNLQYSADFPGAMAAHVEEQLGPNTICLFLQSACGDINPYYDKMKLDEDGVRLMQHTGQQLGEEAVRVARDITTRTPQRPELSYRLARQRLQSRWNADRLLPELKKSMPPERFEKYRRYLTTPLDAPVTTLLINNEIAVMGMPGEPFIDFAFDFRSRSPVKDAFFVGYANGYCGYFPTIEAAVSGGYGADSVGARAEVGAGEAMVDRAIITLYEMLGMLQSNPSR